MDNKLLLIEVICPKCEADLNEGDRIPLDGMVVDTGARGVIKLSAFFGEYGIETDLNLPQGALVRFCCPRCEESLMISQQCGLCHAPLVSLEMKKGGHADRRLRHRSP